MKEVDLVVAYDMNEFVEIVIVARYTDKHEVHD